MADLRSVRAEQLDVGIIYHIFAGWPVLEQRLGIELVGGDYLTPAMMTFDNAARPGESSLRLKSGHYTLLRDAREADVLRHPELFAIGVEDAEYRAVGTGYGDGLLKLVQAKPEQLA